MVGVNHSGQGFVWFRSETNMNYRLLFLNVAKAEDAADPGR
jgi:hypothetical protein